LYQRTPNRAAKKRLLEGREEKSGWGGTQHGALENPRGGSCGIVFMQKRRWRTWNGIQKQPRLPTSGSKDGSYGPLKADQKRRALAIKQTRIREKKKRVYMGKRQMPDP